MDSDLNLGLLGRTPDLNDESSEPASSSLFHGQDGDVILQTSDSVDFRVFKIILSLASPVFKTMFDLPQPAGTDDDGGPPPSISISESSITLDLLLRFCYPVDAPRLVKQDVSVIGDVLGAALKYEVRSVIRAAGRALRECALLNSKNAHAACHLHLEAEARAAAIACLKWPFPGPVVPQLALMTGMDHYNLLDYHRRAADCIVSMYTSYEFIETCAAIMPTTHSCSGGGISFPFFVDGQPQTVIQYSWLTSSKQALTNAFNLAPLNVEKLSLSTFAPILDSNACHFCKNKLFHGWEQTRPAIIALMIKKLEEVSLDLSWKRNAVGDEHDIMLWG